MEQLNEHEEDDWSNEKSSNGDDDKPIQDAKGLLPSERLHQYDGDWSDEESSVGDGSKSSQDAKELLLRKNYPNGVQTPRNICAKLAKLLQNPTHLLTELDLSHTIMDDEEAASLAIVLSGESRLEEIDLSHISLISEKYWKDIFVALTSQTCTLERLSLRGNNAMTDDVALSLAKVLANNTTLKDLDLSLIDYRRRLSIASWRAIFGCLQSPICKLEGLKLARTIFNDDIMISLARSLAINGTLRELDLSDNENVTATGWNVFLTILENPASAMENLDMSFNSINDDVVYTLTGSLAENCKLMALDLNCNHAITAQGCEHFSTVLQSPGSALEQLHLRYNSMNSESMVSLANALARNNKLRELLIYNEDILDVTSDGWATFERILCDKSSIMATYNSNHTLEQLIHEEVSEDDMMSLDSSQHSSSMASYNSIRSFEAVRNELNLPGNINALLFINRVYSKSQAARLKIIKTHFTGENVDIQPFIGMDLNILPHAIAWASKDCEGFDLAYQLLSRAMVPILDGTDGNSTKRKRKDRSLSPALARPSHTHQMIETMRRSMRHLSHT